jgi:endonuclease/exonuclease/phosphatase family metal-dependent hydrolase
MPNLLICSFNVEWMNDWFTSGDGPAAFRPTFTKDGHTSNTHQTASRTADVFKAINADAVGIQEAPSRPEELALFISQYLTDANGPMYDFIMGDSGSAQKLAVLYKPQRFSSAVRVASSEVPTLVNPWQCDVDGDGYLNEYAFTRIPLTVDLTAGGHKLRTIVMHTKSNFVNYGSGMWNNPATRQNYVVEALKNRRRNSAEGSRVRTYLNQLLFQNMEERVIVMGDLNDGPGRDYFEELYLTHNVTDIIVGSAFEPEFLFFHAQHDVPAAQRYTAVFDDFVTGENGKQLLLDHIVLSPGLCQSTGLRKVANSGAVRHTEWNAQVVNNGRFREDRPSDHRPTTVQLTY